MIPPYWWTWVKHLFCGPGHGLEKVYETCSTFTAFLDEPGPETMTVPVWYCKRCSHVLEVEWMNAVFPEDKEEE